MYPFMCTPEPGLWLVFFFLFDSISPVSWIQIESQSQQQQQQQQQQKHTGIAYWDVLGSWQVLYVKVVAAQSLDVSAVPVIIQGRIWLARAAASCWVARDVGHLLSGNPQLVEIRMAFWATKTGTNRAHSSLIGLYSRGWRFVLWPYENRNWPTTSMIGYGGGFLWLIICIIEFFCAVFLNEIWVKTQQFASTRYMKILRSSE